LCQQWFSVVGLVLDVIGFLIIAFEWKHGFDHSVLLRQARVEEDYELTASGKATAKKRREADASMWRNMQRENAKDNVFRARIFWTGVTLVVLGFLGQLVGSLPYGNSVFHFASCS
jgi:hypothetical protein